MVDRDTAIEIFALKGSETTFQDLMTIPELIDYNEHRRLAELETS